jgi:hypothetical protein
VGRAAKRTQARRSALRHHQEEMRQLGEQWQDPVMQEKLSGLFDDQCAMIRDADRAAQMGRLHAAQWRLREENRDGIGHWRRRDMGLIHSVAREADGQVWAHVSVSYADNTMPGWYEVRNAGWLLYPSRFGIVVVAPENRHVNLANVAHVWYCLTGLSCPDFSHGFGTI